jgi:hypothetical protein
LKNFGPAVHKKNQGLAQKRNSKGKMIIKPTQQSSRNSGIRNNLTQGRNQIKRKICPKNATLQLSKIGHYKNHCPKLKKRKETHEASVVEEREPSKKAKQDKTDFFF